MLRLAALLSEGARFFSDRVAAVLGDERVTYQQLWERACAFAETLRASRIEPGDRVAILIPNCIDFPVAYYAILALGAIVVPVHALLTPDEAVYVLQDSGAKLLVGHSALPAGSEAATRAGITYRQITRDLAVRDNDGLPIAREAHDDAVILYTSGTTGKPKGAVLTNLNMLLNASAVASDLLNLTADDVLLCALPLFHSFGQTAVMNAGFRAGASIVLMPRFDPKAALDLMVREKVTVFLGVPTMYFGLLEAAKHDVRRPPLKRMMSGGAPLPLKLLRECEEIFGARILEGYGLSETSPVATFNHLQVGPKPGTVGTPIWGVDVKIARSDLEDRIELMPPGALGEIVIRGHCVFSRYLNNPSATAAAKIDGWFRSGDLGTMDDDGFITILDRKKDMILRGGFNVYPREVEESLMQHPGVAQVAVLGVPDEVHGEEVLAVIRLHADGGDSVTADAIVAWSRERMAKYKYPRLVEFVDAFPLGPSGKVLKRELAARFATLVAQT